jgi:hypothetical protein
VNGACDDGFKSSINLASLVIHIYYPSHHMTLMCPIVRKFNIWKEEKTD